MEIKKLQVEIEQLEVINNNLRAVNERLIAVNNFLQKEKDQLSKKHCDLEKTIKIISQELDQVVPKKSCKGVVAKLKNIIHQNSFCATSDISASENIDSTKETLGHKNNTSASQVSLITTEKESNDGDYRNICQFNNNSNIPIYQYSINSTSKEQSLNPIEPISEDSYHSNNGKDNSTCETQFIKVEDDENHIIMNNCSYNNYINNKTADSTFDSVISSVGKIINENTHGDATDFFNLKISLPDLERGSSSNKNIIKDSGKKSGKLKKHNEKNPSQVKLKELAVKKAFKKPSSRHHSYGPNLLEAYFHVKSEGISVAKAAKKYGVPRTTLSKRVNGKICLDVLGAGAPTLLSREEEIKLGDFLRNMFDCGYNLTTKDVLDISADYAHYVQKRGANTKLTKSWLIKFYHRHPSIKVSRDILRSHEPDVDSFEYLQPFYQKLKATVLHWKFNKESIFNVDEKGLYASYQMDPSASFSKRTEEDYKLITFLACGNAAGENIPPFFVFNEKEMFQGWLSDAQEVIPGTGGSVSSSGWSDKACFEVFIKEHFLPALKQQPTADQPILLIYDGHLSIANISLIEWAAQRHVILFCLFAHTRHSCGPLNVACFKHLENLFSEKNSIERQLHEEACLSHESCCRMICEIYNIALSPSNLINGFRATGIFPLDEEVAIKKSVELTMDDV